MYDSSEEGSQISIQAMEGSNLISQVDQILSRFKKKYVPYMSVRAIKYSPCFPFLAKRTHFEGKVEKHSNIKKQLLVDEQLTNIKTIINENIRLNQLVPAKGVEIQDPQSLEIATAQVKAQYHLLSIQSKNNLLRVQKRQRNYSEPKFRQRSRKEKLTPKYSSYSLSNEKQQFYFMGQGQYRCMESRFLRYRKVRTNHLNFIDTPNCLLRLINSWKQSWTAILNNIKLLSKYVEQDIFVRTFITNNLKEYRQSNQLNKNCFPLSPSRSNKWKNFEPRKY